jgi:hypothetical protein
MSDNTQPIAYVSDGPRKTTPTSDELRARIPGWGADLDLADRPSGRRLDRTLPATGAHWDFPDRQPGGEGRERSIEHAFLTPVFGTTAPLHGVSGRIRRFAYRYSEGRLAHWLLLVLGDRIDTLGSHVASLVSGHPDNPVAETGIRAEGGNDPIGSRARTTRADTHHSWLDPVVVAGPYLLAAFGAWRLIRRIVRG